MKRSTFYQCPVCGAIAIKVTDAGKLFCCGKPMEVIEPNTTDAAQEKHVPVIELDGDDLTVTVGSVEHPMAEDHWINWIYAVTEEGVHARCLKPGDEPKASFDLEDEKLIEVYEYCNKHGLWKAEA